MAEDQSQYKIHKRPMDDDSDDDHEEKTGNDEQMNKIIIPSPDKASIEQLPKQVQELYNHKAKYNINDNGSLTFHPTPNCKPGNAKLPTAKIPIKNLLQKQDCKSAACYSNPNDQIVQTYDNDTNSFISSSLEAWSNHYPFRMKVEHIWLLILQAVAVHVDKNAEKLRSKYVKHDGKKELTVEVSPNPSYEEWMGTIENFAAQIDKNTVKDTCEIFECDFSGSTLTERIATKVTIMDICKNYFSYVCMTNCGFPEVTLDGTKQDWIKLKSKTVKLLNTKVTKKFGSQWGEALLPLLDRFIVAFDGKIDCLFWNSMIKRGATYGSGSRSWYSGWFNILFPFIEQRWNRFCVPYSMSLDYVSSGDRNDYGNGNDTSKYPMGIASAPVKWKRMGKELELKFLAGFVGYTQDQKTMELCPNIGWCIGYANDKKNSDKSGSPKNLW
eukprot:CAMPEP_0201567008 /NCGR_PEP_ID=MMETSP0190_2-20130828/7227_1 /ASSEMBLY_ACC=CAM_ASM_000263 /TAXON_ID=37353 /ORGANISM="Rosalina sp." /LENGTH=440 /DNA_ID=CAMNT_0047986463 /DNA_START=37 /DNA_END=1356 /DNA_ORIENTATION=+